VIVVADELFTMADKPLMQLARLSVPNTLKESSLVAANPANSTDPNWKNTNGLIARITDREVNLDDGRT
jgi:hypothetical protein